MTPDLDPAERARRSAAEFEAAAVQAGERADKSAAAFETDAAAAAERAHRNAPVT
jgi:hypothetical protein